MSNPANERSSIADRSLDRVKASNFLLGQSKDAVMSRQDLIKNEYRKVIKNHPSTLINTSDTYDDTDFLNRMFAKDKEILEGLKPISESPVTMVRSEST
jgi:hypothetical protein